MKNASGGPLIISLLALVIATGAGIHSFFNDRQVMYIDTGRLLNEYRGMIDAKAAYEKKADQWQANVDTLQKEVTAAIMNYEKEAASLTNKEKQLSQELIRNKQQQFQQYQQAITQQSRQEDAAMTQQVLDKVNGFLKTYGDRHGYEFILGTGQGGNIVYADEAFDLTEEVLEQLNNEYQGL